MNGTLNGTMNGTLNGTMNGTLNGTMNGTLNGTMNGTLNGTMNGTIPLQTTQRHNCTVIYGNCLRGSKLTRTYSLPPFETLSCVYSHHKRPQEAAFSLGITPTHRIAYRTRGQKPQDKHGGRGP
ncbi:hypothetical protein BaRGS_00009393 [Batillaria attramentaria]|uniref:Uncharacterized protein n=1 Tax=Batillaria attramentaria TaxID=370345 RepID=A0ABD0LJ19_9CAEN